MNTYCIESPPFCSMVRASGLGEVWSHSHDLSKFSQFGWRCTNTENSYSNSTLVGNWGEERFDIERQKKAKRLPSQFEHYFETTYGSSHCTKQSDVPKELKHLKARHSHAHPGHQPELDHPRDKAIYNSWETTSRAAYIDPKARCQPLVNGSPPGGATSSGGPANY